jgi:tetratricopeptide (TPR) repeat protein
LILVRDKIKTNNNFPCRKSQIAIEYCYRYSQDHPEAHVFWVHASSPARFAAAYHRIGEELALPDVNNPEVDTIELVQKWLSNDANGPWLLVVDNADDIETFFGLRDYEAAEQDGENPKALYRCLPQSSNGSMILTTRDKRIGQRLAKLEKPIDVLPFEMGDAKHLLQKTLHDNDLDNNHSAALLEALDFLPMAITQAAAFIRENDISVLEYLGYLRASDKGIKDLLAESYHDEGRDPESRNSVFQTWKISFDCIRKQKPRAADLLALMAVLDRQAIPKALLCEDNESEVHFATAIGTLKAFSLITEETIKGTYGMHRLIQLSTQRWLELEDMIEEWQKKAINVVCRLCTDDYVFIGDWKNWGAISSHAQVVLNFVFPNDPFLLERAVILHRLAIHELERGYVVNADAWAQESLDTIQKLEGDHPKKLAIAKTVAAVLSGQLKFEAAEKIHRQLLEQRKRAFGPSHPDTLLSLADVAYAMGRQGKYQDAEALQRQLVEAWATSPDLATHRFRFCCLTDLADTLDMQGMHEEAEETVRKAIDGHNEALGEKHPFTTYNLSLLSSVLTKQNKLEAAEAIARRVVEDYECSLGPQHRYTLASIAQVAHILERQNKWEEAEPLRRRAFDSLETLFGPEDSDTVFALGALAYTLANQGKYEEAESVLWQVLRGWESKSGPEELSTISAMSCLAFVLESQGKWEDGERLRRRVLDGFKSLRGPAHEETLRALMTLASSLDQQEKFDEAEPVVREALRGYEDRFGPEHRGTLAAFSLLALVLEGQAKYVESEAVSLRAFRAYEIAFGPKHPHTALGLGHVAFAMVKEGKFEAAETMCRPMLISYQEELGSNYVALTALLDSVAEALAGLGRYEEAEPLRREASTGFEEMFGIEHPLTLASLEKLALILENRTKYYAARAVRQRVYLLEATSSLRKMWNPRYFPKCRRFMIAFLTWRARPGKPKPNLSRLTCNV